jgi:hypothetical protein
MHREAQRERQSRRIAANSRQIRQGIQLTDLPHQLPLTAIPGRTNPYDKGRLEVRIQKNTPETEHGREVVHLHRWATTDGLEDDVRRSPQPGVVERHLRGRH